MDDKKIRLAVGALAVSATCLVGIATHEGYRSEAYKDAVGIPTIGFGETAGVKMGDKTTPERALVQLLESTEKHETPSGNAYTFRSTSTNSTPTSVWHTTSGQGRSADPHW